MTLSKHFDTHGRIKEVQYEIFRSLMYWMTVQYDSMGRVVKRELKIGPYANTTQYRYDYDGDGQLSGVKVKRLLGRNLDLIELIAPISNPNVHCWSQLPV